MSQIDFTGIAVLLTSISSLIGVIVGAWITVKNSRIAAETSIETAKKVDGTLTKLEDAAFAKGALAENRIHQRVAGAVAAVETPPDAKAILAALAKLLKVDE